ncbi:hypothetical protein HZA96_00030 [Candidatus Woesearchaeota archaeon]|nr:hypothetical protein [Candidatus Woesearchaeota archaeon]
MNNNLFRKLIAIVGIIIVVSHLTFYFLRPYNMWMFFIGFGVIWVIFLWLPKQFPQ